VTGGHPPEGLRIELVEDFNALREKVRGATGHVLPDWVGGVALPSAHRIIIRLDIKESAWQRVDGILIHELCHIVVHHLLSEPTAAALPRWLDEGLAQFAEGRLFAPDSPNLAMRAFFGRVHALADLEDSFPRSEGASSLAYAQSLSFVAFLDRQIAGREPLRDLLRRMRNGTSFPDAAHEVFLFPVDQLEERWMASLRDDKSWVPAVLGQLFVGLFLIVAVIMGASRIVKRRREGLARLTANETADLDPEEYAGENPDPDTDPIRPR
jgi:hypothetical protein